MYHNKKKKNVKGLIKTFMKLKKKNGANNQHHLSLKGLWSIAEVFTKML